MPLIRRIIASSRDEVSQVGASQAAGRWTFYDILKDELEACCLGTRAQRKGVAATAAHLVADDKHFDRSQALIERFLDDPDGEVRAETRMFLRYGKFLKSHRARRLLLKFVRTQAFHDDPVQLMFALEQNVAQIRPFADIILDAAAELCGALHGAQSAIDRRFHAAEQLSSLLLRVYEQSEPADDQTIRERCLDAWDALLESGIGPAKSLTRQLDAQA